MKRRILIGLLGLGTVFGFSTGFASVSHSWHHRAERRQAHFEAHIAEVCVDAARRGERVDRDGERWDEPEPRPRHRWRR